MEVKSPNKNIQFLAGGGEMGKLTREKDWGKTSLGDPQTWPQSLRTTLSIILNSKFPMFLFWGNELTCFYNDAYRPSLGKNGKHPYILGMSGEEAWPEIWEIIKPLIDQVLAGGEATWSEDQLIPIYRNGKIEDVYWTFSYSPVNDETGNPAGVFVTCTESTEKINLLKQLKNSNDELEFAIEATELGTWDYDPATNKFTANKRLKQWFGLMSHDKIELDHAINAIASGDKERVTAAIQKALDPSSGGHYDIEYTIVHPASQKRTKVRAKGKAWFNEEGDAVRFNGTLEDITEQTAALLKIAQNELELRNMILQAPIGICLLDAPSLVCEIVNESFIEVAGKTYEEIAGKFYWDTFAEARPYYEAALNKVVTEGTAFFANEVELMLIRHGKEENIFVTFVYAPLRNADGNVNKVAVWVLENTRQVIARQELEKITDKLNIVINASELATWELILKTGEVHYSDRYLEILGYEKGTLKTHPQLLKHLHPEDLSLREEAFSQAISTGILSYETRIVRNDGSIRWVEARGKVFYDAEGNPLHLIGTLRDISDEKDLTNKMEKMIEERTKELIRTNESFQKSERRYHLMVEEVQDYAILYINREGIVENWNTGAERIKGYKADEIIGRSFFNFYTVEDRQNNLPQTLLNEAIRTGRAGQEGWRVRKDGTRFWASVVITAVHDEEGNVMGFSKVTHDLTDKKNSDDALKKNASELEQKNTELEKMNKELQSFAYISSHDLQEPLRKIQTFASRILEKEYENLSETGKQHFSRMQVSANRMQVLINDLLAYSRTHTGDRKFEMTNLGDIVNEIREDLKEELQHKKGIIEVTDLCSWNIIPFQFRQLFYNLVSNSLKFSVPGRIPHIKIKTEIVEGLIDPELPAGQKYCHICITDNGIGFEQQYSEKIFELFQQLHGKMEYTGTGVGLAIVKKIIENHNGIITANAEMGQGARFDIYIPEL